MSLPGSLPGSAFEEVPQMLRIPTYCHHKPTGQGRVTLGGKDFYLGPHGSQDSLNAYQRLIGEYIATKGRPPAPDKISLAELAAG